MLTFCFDQEEKDGQKSVSADADDQNGLYFARDIFFKFLTFSS